MILSDYGIITALADGSLEITPRGDGLIRSASVDLRLGPVLKIEDRNAEGGWREHDLRESGPYRLYRATSSSPPRWSASALATRSGQRPARLRASWPANRLVRARVSRSRPPATSIPAGMAN